MNEIGWKWAAVVVCAAIATGAGACGSSGGHAKGSGAGGAGGVATTSSGGVACKTDADCAAQVPDTTPPGCALSKCNTVRGACELVAKDQDGDGQAAANCTANDGTPVQVGDDCDDEDPGLLLGHPKSCSALPGGATITWPTGAPKGVCKYGQISCQPNGTPSACEGAVAPGKRDCSSTMDVDCDGKDDDTECACVPGTAQCAGNGVETCQPDGTPGAAVPCVNQTCVNGKCQGICAPGQTQCEGNGVKSCQPDGSWGAPASCGNQACVNGQCQGVCAPGQTTCSGQQPQVCDTTGHWQDNGPACNHQTCIAGSCQGICAPGETAPGCPPIQSCQTLPATCDGTGHFPSPQCNYACSEFQEGKSQNFGCSNLCSGASCNFQYSATCPAGTTRTQCVANCVDGCCTGGNKGGCSWSTSWNSSTPSDATCDLHIGTSGCNGTTMSLTVYCKGP
jgi:hypothetical protein